MEQEYGLMLKMVLSILAATDQTTGSAAPTGAGSFTAG
jgi:hypothetical protein